MARELPSSHAEVVLEGFLALETPEGFRAELVDDEIVLTPPPDGDHEDYLSLIMSQVIRQSATDMDFSGNKGLIVPRGGLCVRNHVIPDATFVPTELRLFRGAAPWMPCEGVSMVAEVTSTKPDRDRTAKRHCYARGGIDPPLPSRRPGEERHDALQRSGGRRLPPARHGPLRQAARPARSVSFSLETTDFV